MSLEGGSHTKHEKKKEEKQEKAPETLREHRVAAMKAWGDLARATAFSASLGLLGHSKKFADVKEVMGKHGFLSHLDLFVARAINAFSTTNQAVDALFDTAGKWISGEKKGPRPANAH